MTEGQIENHWHIPSIPGLPGSKCKLCGGGFLGGIHNMGQWAAKKSPLNWEDDDGCPND